MNESQSGVVHYLVRSDRNEPMSDVQAKMVEYCIQSGSDVNAKNKFGETPLHQAAMRSAQDVCAFLLKHGARINQTNLFGESALHKAVMLKDIGLVKLLLDAGADPSIESRNGLPRDLVDRKTLQDKAILEVLIEAERTFRDTSEVAVNTGERDGPQERSHDRDSVISKDFFDDWQGMTAGDSDLAAAFGGASGVPVSVAQCICGKPLNPGAKCGQCGASRPKTHVVDVDDGDASKKNPLHVSSPVVPTSVSPRGKPDASPRGKPEFFRIKTDASTVRDEEPPPGITVVRGSSRPGSRPGSRPNSRPSSRRGEPQLSDSDQSSVPSPALIPKGRPPPPSMPPPPVKSQHLNRERELRQSLATWVDDDDDDGDGAHSSDNDPENPPDFPPTISPRPADGPSSSSKNLLAAPSSGRRRAGSQIGRNSPAVTRLLRRDQDSSESGACFTTDHSFRQEETGFGRLDDLVIKKLAPETYREDFLGKEHHVFLCSEGVVCILVPQARNSHLVLVLDQNGYRKMSLPALQLTGKDFVQGCLSWISLNVFPNCDIYMVEDDAQLRKELLRIESMAPENSTCFRIGVVYAGEDDEEESQMFVHNSAAEQAALFNFMSLFSDEIELMGWGGFKGQLSTTAAGTSYYANFHGCEIMFHVAPLLTPEQHRRLIGNDTVIIYFHNSSKKPFPSQAPRSIMGQVFVVVKNLEQGKKLRVGFMSRKKVADYGPQMPVNPVFDVTTPEGRDVFRDFLLCRVINAYRAAMTSPPLDKMLKRPRVVVIEKLLEAYPMSAQKKKFILKKK